MSTDNSIQLRSNVKDETGEVYGRLTVLGYAGSKLKALPGAYWNCRCECGNETIVGGRALRNKTIQSCGCSKQRTNEVGSVYNKLTVLEFAGNTKGGDSRWLCLCECGNMTTVARSDLRKESIKSCGCHRASAGGATAGRKVTPEYTSWKEMRNRCYNPNYKDRHLYSGRGITICQHWFASFVNFLEDMGKKPFAEASIDRIDNDGNYSCGHCEECASKCWPANCRWATKLEQGQNTRKAIILTHNGETLCLRAWARKLGITHRTLTTRLERGWTIAKALTTAGNRSRCMLTHDGETLCLAEWARRTGIKENTLRWRFSQGWTEDRIFSVT